VTPRLLPLNDSSDDEQQSFLGWLLSEVLARTPDVIFCSESYGPACAGVLTNVLGHNVTGVIMDLARNQESGSVTQRVLNVALWLISLNLC
jgi:hypothetical protein